MSPRASSLELKWRIWPVDWVTSNKVKGAYAGEPWLFVASGIVQIFRTKTLLNPVYPTWLTQMS